MSDPRVVTLVASATEIVCALGAEKWIVGISHECDYPEYILSKPRCTSSIVHSELSSDEINCIVQKSSEAGESLYRVDFERIEALRPTVIIMQDQCDVCAVGTRDFAVDAFKNFSVKPQIVTLRTSCFADLYDDVLKIARALRIEGRAFELCDSMRSRLKVIQNRTRKFPKKRVACLEWLNPLMIAGYWMSELCQMVGGITVLNNVMDSSRTITFDDLFGANPDVVVCMPCGFSLKRAVRDAELLMNDPSWRKLKAFQSNCVYAVDGNTYFSRPGPRLVDSTELMAQLLHPTVFDFPNFEAAYYSLGAARTNDRRVC